MSQAWRWQSSCFIGSVDKKTSLKVLFSYDPKNCKLRYRDGIQRQCQMAGWNGPPWTHPATAKLHLLPDLGVYAAAQ